MTTLGLTPDPVRIDRLSKSSRRGVIAPFALLLASLASLAVPRSWTGFGGEVAIDGRSFGQFVPGLMAVVTVGIGVRLAWTAARGTRAERAIAAAAGLGAAVISADALRVFLEAAVLRQAWRPLAIFGSPVRGLATAWFIAAGCVHLVGFVAGLLAIVVAALPPRLAQRLPRRLRDAAAIASWVPLAGAGLLIVGHVVLTRKLLAVMGSSAPHGGGTPLSSQGEIVFNGIWPHLGSLAVLQFALGIWGAVELARLVNGVTGSRVNPALRTSVRLAPALAAVGSVAALAAAIGLARGRLLPSFTRDWADAPFELLDVLNGDRVVGSFALQAIAAAGMAASVVALALWGYDERHDVEGWMRKTVFHPLAPLFPVVAILCLGPLVEFMSLAWRSLLRPLRFPLDAIGYIDYWARIDINPSYGVIHPSEVVVPIAGGFAMLAIIILIATRSTLVLPFLGVLVGIAVLAPSAEAPETILLLIASYAIAHFCMHLVLGDEHWWVRPIRMGLYGVLVLAFLTSPDLPSGVVLVGSVLLRLAWQAGALNDAGGVANVNRLQLALALPLVLGGLLLAEESAAGIVNAEAFAALGEAIAVPFLAMPFFLLYPSGPKVDDEDTPLAV